MMIEQAAPELTDREREILVLRADGRTPQEVALTLGISRRTVEYHQTSLAKKLGVRGMFYAVLRAGALGLLDSNGTGFLLSRL